MFINYNLMISNNPHKRNQSKTFLLFRFYPSTRIFLTLSFSMFHKFLLLKKLINLNFIGQTWRFMCIILNPSMQVRWNIPFYKFVNQFSIHLWILCKLFESQRFQTRMKRRMFSIKFILLELFAAIGSNVEIICWWRKVMSFSST